MYIKRILSITFVMLMVMPTAFSAASSPLVIYTSNYPLTYFAERIGAAHVNVVFPAPPDVDPAFWRPDEATIRDYQKADLIILNGAGYEKWTKVFSLPIQRTVDTSKAFRDSLIYSKTDVTHNHGPAGDHSHSGIAFTTWLDFQQAAMQAEAIFKALARKLPEHREELARNYDALKMDLLALDRQMAELSEIKPGLPLVASHPIYQYMARRYSLNLQMVLWEPDEAPGEADWNHLQSLVQGHQAKWMVWEGAPLKASKTRLELMNIESLIFDPCYSKPEKGDFLSVMQENIRNIATAF